MQVEITISGEIYLLMFLFINKIMFSDFVVIVFINSVFQLATWYKHYWFLIFSLQRNWLRLLPTLSSSHLCDEFNDDVFIFLHQWHWYWRQFSLNRWMTWSTNQLISYIVFSVNLFLKINFFFFSNFLFISCKEMSSSHLQFFLFIFLHQSVLFLFFIFWMSKKIPSQQLGK